MIVLILIILGLSLGSFVNALVWRIHEKKDFVKERSICVNCGRVLAWYDLVPVFSWLTLSGKCRYCKKPISWQYPLVEAATATLFVLSYFAWLDNLNSWQDSVMFGFWLVQLTGLIALFIYDVRWMILPNKIIYPLISLAAVQRLFEMIFISTDPLRVIQESVFGLLVGGGIFYAIFQISSGKWIGGGDVKLGFLIGLLLGPKFALIALLIAFYSAALIILPLLALKKINRKSHIPFGPFLIGGLIITMLAMPTLDSWFDKLFVV